MPPGKPSSRLAYLDWTRGMAAAIMLQGHVFNSFLRTDLRKGSVYLFSDFLGGLPSAIFLFLTGVTMAFLMDSRERQGWPANRRILASLKRAGYLFGVALLFRLQLWAFAWPGSPWTDLLRVDILNVMGFSLGIMSLMAAFRTMERVRYCAILGVAIAAASPLVSQIDWTPVPSVIKNYLAPDVLQFGFFPWAAFAAFGLSLGSLIRQTRPEQMDRVMQWIALIGCGLIIAFQYFSNSPYSLYGKSDFWLNSPCMVLIKTGVILLMMAFAFLWTRNAEQKWSWVAQLGTTSLLVYWVHTEIIYGRWLAFWHANLDVAQTAIAAGVTIVCMIGLSLAQTHRARLLALISSGLRLPRAAPSPEARP